MFSKYWQRYFLIIALVLAILGVLPLVPAGAVDGHETYTIKRGDTLWDIAQRYGTSVETLKRSNGLKGDLIFPGQILAIPASRPASHVASRNTPAPAINQGGSPNDVEWLARIIAAEARGESFMGQVAVGAVVLNRVQSEEFPDSIYGVVFHKVNSGYQFTPAKNGTVFQRPTAEAFEAARWALRGYDPTNGSLYFYNPRLTSSSNWIRSRQVLQVIGNHRFAA